MTGSGRRLRAALLIGSAAALSLPAGAARPARPAVSADYVAPDSPVILTRELRRAAGRTKQIITRRSYELRFVREGTGWRVDGTLIRSEVEAPAELAELAALEKARKDDGLFPLRLDRRGLILAQRTPVDGDSARMARSMASGAVEKINMSSADKIVAKEMIQRITAQSEAAGGTWPIDLFRPAAQPSVAVRDIPLPGGKQGRVTVTMQASPDREGQLMQLDRRVLTEIDGTSRLSIETWSMRESR